MKGDPNEWTHGDQEFAKSRVRTEGVKGLWGCGEYLVFNEMQSVLRG